MLLDNNIILIVILYSYIFCLNCGAYKSCESVNYNNNLIRLHNISQPSLSPDSFSSVR